MTKRNLEKEIFDTSSNAVLVNKTHSLGANYVPAGLIAVDVPTTPPENPEVKELKKEAADKLKDLFKDAEKNGFKLYALSGYRSYDRQVNIFNNNAKKNGEEAANKYSARPGQSEHQTGLVMDITSASVDYILTGDFGEVPDGIWVAENAHKYGFIVRYPRGKEPITGYIYEPWHLRYMGEDLATEVYNSGITYEEYLRELGIDIDQTIELE